MRRLGCTVGITYHSLYRGVRHLDGYEVDDRGPCGCHISPEYCQYLKWYGHPARTRFCQKALEADMARVQQELAKRNAVERSDQECPVCFDEFGEEQRCCLPCSSKHWLCKGCLSDLTTVQQQKSPPEGVPCPHCRAEVPDAALLKLLA